MYEKKKKQMIVTMSLMMVGLLMCLLPSQVVHADDKLENVVGFTYKIDYPDNQIGGENGYFDIEAKPNTEQTVMINLSNSSKKPITVNISVNGTKTNSNGVLEYGPADIENDASLKFPFEERVSAPESVEIKGGEVKQVPIKVKMPNEAFEGIILGGIQMKQADKEDEKPQQGATVRNTYSYVVAMRLQNNQTPIDPEIKINKASGSQRNYRNSVEINLSNITGSLIKDTLSIESQITKKGSHDVLYERKQTGMSMAPNSQMDFFVSMNGEQMVPGNYRARVLVTSGDKSWEENLDFTITKEDAEKYNKRDVGLVQNRGIDWKIILLIVASILGLLIVIFVISKVIKNKQKQQRRKSRKKSSSKNKDK